MALAMGRSALRRGVQGGFDRWTLSSEPSRCCCRTITTERKMPFIKMAGILENSQRIQEEARERDAVAGVHRE